MFFSALSTIGILFLCDGYRKETNSKIKKQLKWLLSASLVGYAGGSFNFLLVYGVQIPLFTDLANYAVLAYVFSLAYIIFRYKFLDIEVIIKKTLVFVGIVASAVCVVSIPLGFIQAVLGRAIGVPPFILMICGIVTAVVIYHPLAQWLVRLTDRYLFQKKADYRKLLKEATEYLAHLKSLRKQARRIVTFLVYKARISSVALYAYQSFAPGSLLLQGSRPRIRSAGHKTIALSHPLVAFLNAHRSPLELHSIEAAKPNETDPRKAGECDEIIRLFKAHQAEAVIPCFGSDVTEMARRTKLHLRGILFLGRQIMNFRLRFPETSL